MIKKLLAALAVSVLGAFSANAATISGVVDAYGVDYISFGYTGGSLTIDVDGADDPMIRLFRDNGSSGYLTGAHLGSDDDGGPGLDSRLSFGYLGAGDYILAIGEYYMSRYEARSGSASTPFTAQAYTATIVGSGEVSTVPLPASALLLIGGLAGLGAMRRRKS